MKIGNMNYDHVEIYEETGKLVATISDDEIVEATNCSVKLSESDKMFTPKDEFEQACRPLMKYLATKQHPHTTVIVTAGRSELVEGVKSHATEDFIVD